VHAITFPPALVFVFPRWNVIAIMANWFDVLSFLLTASIFVGVVVGVAIGVKKISEAINNTKETLKAKGVHISDKGVSVKTSSRMSREDYIDATQRGFINSIAATKKAGGFSTADNIDRDGAPPVSRKDSGASFASTTSATTSTDDTTKKRGFLGRKGSKS